MAIQTNPTVIGVFENRADADRAVTELRRLGFDSDQIGLVTRDDQAGPSSASSASPLIARGIRESEVHYYEADFHAGRTLLIVQAGNRYDEARRILRDCGAYDSTTRGPVETDGPVAAHEAHMAHTAHASEAVLEGSRQEVMRVPEIQEELRVAKQAVPIGEVTVHRHIVEEVRTVPVDVVREEVRVERRDVAARPVDADALHAFEEGTIRVPIRAEEAVVAKQAVVTGEVVIAKEQHVEHEQISGTVRRVEVEVDEHYDQARTALRQHFQEYQAPGQAGRTWDEAEPNYRLGYSAGRDARYAGRTFEEVEPDLRRTANHDDALWQRLREEVRAGFHRGRAS